MDYKLKEIVLKYFTAQRANVIQDIIAKYENETNGDERIREAFAEELSSLLYDDIRLLPEYIAELPDARDYLESLLQYIEDNADADDLVTYIDWE